MENHSKARVLITLIILVGLGVGYFLYMESKKEKPYQVVEPESYEPGTTVSLYKSAPPGFPKDVLSGEVLNYAGTVESPSGKEQITVSYVSNKTIGEALNAYSNSLPTKGWVITKELSYDNVGFLEAKKGEQSLLISASNEKEDLILVTLQYQ
ncbi:MAG TPA: hypothetical protein VJC14_00285 [Candidatus Paceibacterota bacterium]